MAARISSTDSGRSTHATDDVGVWLRAQGKKDLVRFVAIGSVGGNSTVNMATRAAPTETAASTAAKTK